MTSNIEIEEQLSLLSLEDNKLNSEDILKTNKTNKIIYSITNPEEINKWINLYNLEYLIINYKNPYLYISLNLSNLNADKLYKPTTDKIEKTINYLDNFYSHNEDLMFGKIYNLSNLGLLDVNHIHLFSKFLKSITHKTRKQVYASAIIIKSPLIISIINIFLSLYKNTRPIKIVDNIKDAKLFIKEQMIYYKENGELSPFE